MCGVVGVIAQDGKRGFLLFKHLLIESQIRGKHSTGMTVVSSKGKLSTTIEDIPAKKFSEKYLNEFIKSDLNIYLGHTRYSTSDLKYGQPITLGKEAISHNGVITQSDPENWEEEFGYSDLKTKNDSELLLRYLQEDNVDTTINEKFPDASIAYGTISNNRLTCYRNGHRPLWFAAFEDVYVFASTKDIILRALTEVQKEDDVIMYGLNCIKEIQPHTVYEFKHTSTRIFLKQYPIDGVGVDEDLQTISKISKHYIGD